MTMMIFYIYLRKLNAVTESLCGYATLTTQQTVNFLITQNKGQIDRFKDAARDVGADESDDALDRIMGKLDLTKKPEPAGKQKGKEK